MKKLFFSYLFIFSSHFAWTQVSAGPFAGVNFSKVAGGNITNKFKTGYFAGAFLKFDITNTIAFQPEMLYSSQGFKQQASFVKSGVSTDTNLTHSLSYIEFPFLLNLSVAGNGFVHFGPQIGYIVNAKKKGSISTESNGSVQTETINTSDIYGFSTTEYALVIGGGYRFIFGLDASVHFTYGITKLYTATGGHNFVIGISVGYKIGRYNAQSGDRIYKQL